MAHYLEVLIDGLTVERKVQMAGTRVQVSEDFNLMTKRKQVKRWGKPRYKMITRGDFLASGGIPSFDEDDEDDEGDEGEQAEDSQSPFQVLDGLPVEATLEAVAGFGEDQLAEFIAYERAGANRVGVLRALDVNVEE